MNRSCSAAIMLAASALVLAAFAGCGDTTSEPGTTTQPSAKLDEYKQRMRDVLAQPKTVFLDADERCNCIVVGVSDQAAAASVETFATNAGVPQASVKTELTQPFRAFQSLRTGIRPIKGGLQIQNEDRSFCTMMATVFNRAREKKGLLTNSHCTRTEGAVDGIEFFQAGGALFSSDFVAREVIDPPLTGTSDCPTGKVCRRSDAAYAEFDTSTVGIVGRLARPIARCTDITTSCGLGMNSTADELRITGVRRSPAIGDTLDKIGRTSGWTSGLVTRTCISANVAASDGSLTNMTMLCQHRVASRSEPGDSGSPVFARGENNQVVLVGILWGGPADNSSFVFSDIHAIESELGAFDYFE